MAKYGRNFYAGKAVCNLHIW